MVEQARSSHRLAGVSSMVGTTIEWYDFFIYGAAAALIFNKLFFPNLDPLTGVLAAFATYAVGFIGRPLGGIVFGHFGDKVGRKSMLMLTININGHSHHFNCLLPTYETLATGQRSFSDSTLVQVWHGRRMGRRSTYGR